MYIDMYGASVTTLGCNASEGRVVGCRLCSPDIARPLGTSAQVPGTSAQVPNATIRKNSNLGFEMGYGTSHGHDAKNAGALVVDGENEGNRR